MSVGKICTREVLTAREVETADQAARRMVEFNVGCLVVVDDSNIPVGIVTDRDLVTEVIATGCDPEGVTVNELFVERPMVIYEESSVEDALRLMRTASCRRLPVIDRRGALVGIVTLDDIFMRISEEFRTIGVVLNSQNATSVDYFA